MRVRLILGLIKSAFWGEVINDQILQNICRNDGIEKVLHQYVYDCVSLAHLTEQISNYSPPIDSRMVSPQYESADEPSNDYFLYKPCYNQWNCIYELVESFLLVTF